MKRSLNLTLALCVGLLIGTVGTALASDSVQAVFQKFNFVIDGEELELGADPLVYQGSTYLPVRVVSNMLGYDVTYLASSRTIELSSKPGKMSAEGESLLSDNKTNEIKRLEYLITATQKQIDNFTADANNPNQSEYNKEFARKVVEEYTQTLADLERQLADLRALQ